MLLVYKYMDIGRSESISCLLLNLSFDSGTHIVTPDGCQGFLFFQNIHSCNLPPSMSVQKQIQPFENDNTMVMPLKNDVILGTNNGYQPVENLCECGEKITRQIRDVQWDEESFMLDIYDLYIHIYLLSNLSCWTFMIDTHTLDTQPGSTPTYFHRISNRVIEARKFNNIRASRTIAHQRS